MAMRLFQFCLVSAVGYFFGPASALIGTSRALSIDSPPPLPASLSQSLKQNVSLRFVEEPSDVIVVRGQDAILRCLAQSTRGNATITWMYEGRPIPAEDPRWSVGSVGAELRIARVAGGKRTAAGGSVGEYACIARNEVGGILSKAARVRLATMDKDVTVLPENLTVYESQPMLLHCGVHSTPPVEVQWEFNQLPLPKDKRYVPLPNGALLIIDTKFTDSGKYRCIAENTILEKIKKSKDLEVNILVPPKANIPPTFLLVNSSVNRTVVIGETIEFFCIATGWPIPTVQWINNKNVTLSNSSTLTIRNAHPKDTGNYTCIASNSLGQGAQKFHLDVYQKPFFNATPTSRSSPSAQTVRLDCQARGIPQPRVYWLKNGEPLAPEVRIKKLSTGLVFSHTVSTDSGTYQCVAVNAVGKVWAAAQIEINNSQSPSPPQNVKCRAFDDDRICLTWKNPPNVSVQAYSVYSFYTSEGLEVSGPEYLTTDTFRLADGLKHSTNYTFYVRLYSKHASDHSERVTCQAGLKGSRNLDIDVVASTSVTLRWNRISSDVLCNGTKDPFMVQWFRDGDESHLSTAITMERRFSVTGLVPATDYQFRIISVNNPQDEPWTMYSLPDIQGTENDTSDAANELRAPKYLHEDATTSTSVKISWDRISNAKFYTVCYVPAKEERDCDEDDFIKSYSSKFSVSKLKPNTEYLFKVRAHDVNNVPGTISQPLTIHTLADVPSPVVDLQYKALNSSTACIHWRPPENKNGKLRNYVVSYTTDPNWSLENLIEYNVPVHQKRSQSCWEDKDRDSDAVSTLLTNLSSDHTYMVMVRAANDVGIGQPLVSTVVKTFDPSNKAKGIVNNPEETVYKQKIGIILGIILAVLCILCCVAFILLRRRCLKRRAVARARLAMSSDYHPAVAHYTTQLGSVQVRMEQPCATDEHEIEHLVSEEQSPNIPPVTPDHLDTKGANDFPNGHVNGTNKGPQMNGTVLNGHVHITENPQYYAYECNGNLAKNKSEPLLRHYEEDSNSNVNPSKFRDFYKLFDGSKKHKGSLHQTPHGNGNLYSTSLGSSKENSLNCTQLTFLNDSVASQRRLSPVLEPNG